MSQNEATKDNNISANLSNESRRLYGAFAAMLSEIQNAVGYSAQQSQEKLESTVNNLSL